MRAKFTDDMKSVIKQCGTCKEMKSLDRFSSNVSEPDGICHSCRDCRSRCRVLYFRKSRAKPDSELKRRRSLPKIMGSDNRTRLPNVSRSRDSKGNQESLRNQVIDCLGGRCPCGYSDRRALQVDHINGGGVKHVRAVSWSIRYKQILKDSTGFQLLCANCNWVKRAENKEYRKPKLKVAL